MRFNAHPNSFASSAEKQETKVVKIRIIGCHNLAKKDIFGASDPYVKVSLINLSDNSSIDTAFTKTKKRVSFSFFY